MASGSDGVMLHGSMIPRSVRRMFDQRGEFREVADSETAVLELRGRKHMVRLLNLSHSGAMVIFPCSSHIGEEVALNMLDRGRVSGHVCWVRDGRIGVNFAAAGE
jgi:hypothetical protein